MIYNIVKYHREKLENMTDNKTKILIIDDDLQICELLKKFLVLNGFEVEVAVDTDAGRKILKANAIDVIILDVMMPKESGVEFLEKLRERDNIPVLMLTAQTEIQGKVKGLLAGANDYIAKPFDPDELLLRIKATLKTT